MKIALIILIILCIGITVKYMLYKRQIKNICRQLAFLEDTTTNYLIRTDYTDKEIIELVNKINSMHIEHMKKEIALLAKDRRLKEALTSVSHDIRTPLTSLKGYFSMLTGETNLEKQWEYVSIMQERMDNLSDLLEELFTYTKLQNQNYTLTLEESNLTRLVLDTLFSFYEEFKKKEIEPELLIDDAPVNALCNPVAVKRIVSNIIRNALIHGNGCIHLSYGASQFGYAFVCENTLEHPENIDVGQIFDRFYKADKARSLNSTGLGLSIAKELAERMNGSIQAKLTGNTFRIEVHFPVLHTNH